MFEWDAKKSKQNQEKHGVSFADSLEIWQASHLTASRIAKSKDGESRSASIGYIQGKLYTAIWTKRGDKIRLICVRRARNGEEKIFQDKKF